MPPARPSGAIVRHSPLMFGAAAVEPHVGTRVQPMDEQRQ
jgi:hypothetical protein